MYQEWMDGVPLLFEGMHDNNIRELEKAIQYYEGEKNYSIAEAYKKRLSEEKRLKRVEEEYEQCHPVRCKFKNMIDSIIDIFE